MKKDDKKRKQAEKLLITDPMKWATNEAFKTIKIMTTASDRWKEERRVQKTKS